MRSLLDITGRWHLRRPARLVLVPTGPLGAVPWHAACTGDGPRRRYAVRDLVVSYAVSARTFCESAGHPVRRPASALLVGDPTGDLRFAGVEASAIHAAFHSAGTYLDRATPDDVLRWFATGRGGGSMVHLACHGVIDPDRPADAHLMLAGGTLTVRRLLDATRLAGLQLDQVFLAACTTSATGTEHDEVISLATTFLAAGARTVFGSLWTVPDEATSLLMYMVHRFLAHGRVPADALHAAQLWMLDPARRPAPEMPAELAALCNRAATAEPRAWAAFTHLGR